MEVVHHETQGEDFISSMPENVITNIMDRLRLKDAVGTSILSTSWRFKWTLVTKLVFDIKFFCDLRRRKLKFDKTDISRHLLHLKGGVTKFYLRIMNDDLKFDDEDIHHLVMYLSIKGGLKELSLSNCRKTPLKLPSHLFSCLELKHLKLYNCVLSPPPPYFRGFPKLLSLDLWKVRFQGHHCGELIAQSPLLETLSIKPRVEMKLVEIAKFENVKMLSLSLCLLDNMTTAVRLSSVFQQMSLLPKLEELNIRLGECNFLAEDVPVSITFPFLQTLILCEMDFSSHTMLSCTFGMLFGCANLQTLHMRATYKNADTPPAICSPEVDCGQLQLRNVRLEDIKGWESEVCLIKYMLASSPMLERFVIIPDFSMQINGKNKLASKLLKLRRASPVAEIIF